MLTKLTALLGVAGPCQSGTPGAHFSTLLPSLETAGIAIFLEGWFPTTSHPTPLLLLCPSSMLGLPVSPGLHTPSPGPAVASGTFVSR